ncbi:MAG: hypothetical protein JWN30_2858 [Bacilli bacterium]|nr:hypothetical protein [Bacilli bacterium]
MLTSTRIAYPNLAALAAFSFNLILTLIQTAVNMNVFNVLLDLHKLFLPNRGKMWYDKNITSSPLGY